jgi:hypothetical protein
MSFHQVENGFYQGLCLELKSMFKPLLIDNSQVELAKLKVELWAYDHLFHPAFFLQVKFCQMAKSKSKNERVFQGFNC